MKLSWFLSEKHLFSSEGDVALVGQTIYLHDYSIQPPIDKRKYSVTRVDRSITLSTSKPMYELDLKSEDPIDRYYEAIEVIEKESEGGKVTGVALPYFKLSRDEAQIHLESWKIKD